MEAQAVKDGLYVDYDVITAVNGYAAVKCTATEKNGKRFIRIASAATVEEAQEASGIMALYMMYDKPVPNEAYGEVSKRSISTAASKENKQTGSSAYPGQKPLEVNVSEKQEAVMETFETFQECASVESTTSATNTAPIDFRMNVGTYENREDNLFSQMLMTDQGKKYIQRLLNVKTPSPKLIPYVEKARAYLDAAKITI